MKNEAKRNQEKEKYYRKQSRETYNHKAF